MLNIKTNTPALQALNNLKLTQKRMGGAMESLSSGLRINSAADDAAGLGIANRMTANLRANDKLSQGINDGISLMQVAEGGLDSINDILQRSRQLAVQAANGTLSDSDRASINAEYRQLRDEIDRIALTTEAFGKYPLAPAPVSAPSPPIPLPPAEPSGPHLGSTPSLAEIFPSSGASKSFLSGIVSTAYIPAGAKNITLTIDAMTEDDDLQIFSRTGQHLVGTPLLGVAADIVWDKNGVTDEVKAQELVLTPENGFLPGAAYSADHLLEGGTTHDATFSSFTGASSIYNGMTFTYSGDGDRYETPSNNGMNLSSTSYEHVNIDEVTEDLILMVVGKGAFIAHVKWDEMPELTPSPSPVPSLPAPPSLPVSSDPVSTPTHVLLSASYGNRPDGVTIEPTPADSASLGLSDVELDPIEKAREALGKLQEAMNKVDGYRGQYGALTNRFEGAIQNLVQESISTGNARSRIMDADYARASVELARAQILQQAGTSVLAQANQMPQGVLSLLK